MELRLLRITGACLLVCLALSLFAGMLGAQAAEPDVTEPNVAETAATAYRDCSAKGKKALHRLFAAKGRTVRSAGEYMLLDSGVVLHKECVTVFGENMPVLVTDALQRGIRCLAATPTATTRSLIAEMAAVLGMEHAAQPVILCRPLASRQMKGMGMRSEEQGKSPFMVLSPVLKDESLGFIEGVVFHEFIHLGGGGHAHGSQRELATPCQGCCFDVGRTGEGARSLACRVCATDYADKFDPAYMRDLTQWALQTPGSEFIARINLLDGVRRAGGDVRFFVTLVREFRDHPFGFELASEVLRTLSLEGDDAALVRSVARKMHGHVTKRFKNFGRTLARAAIARFELARKGEDPERVLEAVSALLLETRLPDKDRVPLADRPYFYKYYYEFALLRGVLAGEVQGLWKARYDALCPDKADCPDLYLKRRTFTCQKAGLDYDAGTDTCR
jgi:hypothetical protein